MKKLAFLILPLWFCSGGGLTGDVTCDPIITFLEIAKKQVDASSERQYSIDDLNKIRDSIDSLHLPDRKEKGFVKSKYEKLRLYCMFLTTLNHIAQVSKIQYKERTPIIYTLQGEQLAKALNPTDGQLIKFGNGSPSSLIKDPVLKKDYEESLVENRKTSQLVARYALLRSLIDSTLGAVEIYISHYFHSNEHTEYNSILEREIPSKELFNDIQKRLK